MSSAAAAFGLDVPCRCLCPLYNNQSTTTPSSLLAPTSSGGAPVADDSSLNRFLLGTSKFSGGGNKIYFVEYVKVAESAESPFASASTSSSSLIHAAAVWQVGSEVWDIQCCPNTKLDRTLFSYIASPAASLGGGGASRLTCELMALGDIYLSTPSRVATLPGTSKLVWDPQGLTGEVRGVVNGTTLGEFKLGQPTAASDASPAPSSLTPATTVRLDTVEGGLRTVHHVAWSPHHSHLVAAAADSRILIADFRQQTPTMQLGGSTWAHGFGSVLGLDFSPSSPMTVMSSGEDGCVRMWDIRRPSSSSSQTQPAASQQLSSQKVHDHWCTRAVFNPYHSELVLTSSADNTCRLWNLPSSDPAMETSMPGGGGAFSAAGGFQAFAEPSDDGGAFLSVTSASVIAKPPKSLAKRMSIDTGALTASPSIAFVRVARRMSVSGTPPSGEGCVATLSDFGDTVSTCCWSLANDSPWVYAAVSANGKMMVDCVSDVVVRKILLDSE